MKWINFIILFFICSGLFTVDSAQAEPVSKDEAMQVVSVTLKTHNPYENYYRVDSGLSYSNSDGKVIFYVFKLSPVGYIIITADTDLPPVMAYSFLNNAGFELEQENVLLNLLKADISNRLNCINKLPMELVQSRHEEWESLLSETPYHKKNVDFQQWPPEGSTSTGGWLETNWTQNAPYNNFCPMDPVTNQRSIAGCPAVAMAQIVNYFATTNETVFTDDDDYYHSYAGRNYWIDDDYEEQDFPSFPELNNWLDTISGFFANQGSLKENEKAALNFACGVAAKQVYTSSISGTFGVSQAFDAYLKFGFESIILMDETDTSLYTTLSNNMKEGRPVHLAVVDPAGTMGHNVVVDGYNTDDFYHLNFGWGGSYNGWYLLPDEIPYGLTVIEGAIVNIAFPPVYTSISHQLLNSESLKLTIYPNPVLDQLNIRFTLTEQQPVTLEINDLEGKQVASYTLQNPVMEINSTEFDLKQYPELTMGIYLLKLVTGEHMICRKIIVQ